MKSKQSDIKNENEIRFLLKRKNIKQTSALLQWFLNYNDENDFKFWNFDFNDWDEMNRDWKDCEEMKELKEHSIVTILKSKGKRKWR